MVQGVARRLVIVGVVHPAADGGVVVPEDAGVDQRANDIAAGLRGAAISDDVAEAHVPVDLQLFVLPKDHFEGVDSAVNVAKNGDAHSVGGQRRRGLCAGTGRGAM